MSQVSDELGAYVYLLIDPRTGHPFYVGKGRGLRHAAHTAEALLPVDDNNDEAESSRKHAQTREILDAGQEPDVWILRYGLSTAEYTPVEAAAIDLLMSFPLGSCGRSVTRPLAAKDQLTNARREKSNGHGIVTLQSLIEEFSAPQLSTEIPVALITLNGWTEIPDGEVIAGGRVRYGAGYKSDWLSSEQRDNFYGAIGESVCAWWHMSETTVSRLGIEHVAAVHRGITRALFRIVPGSWERREWGVDKNGRAIQRSAFQVRAVRKGAAFDEIVGPFGHRVPGRRPGAQNAIDYWPRPR